MRRPTSRAKRSSSTAAWSCDTALLCPLDYSHDSPHVLNRPEERNNMAENAQKVRDIIEKELGVEREKLTDEASFIEDLGADSLDIVELVMEFEKEFNIDIPDEDAEKLRTVGDAVGYLNSKMGSNA